MQTLYSKWIALANPESSLFLFITGGQIGLQYWKLEGSSLRKKLGLFGPRKKSTILNVANVFSSKGWRIAAATSTGDLYFFLNREIAESVDGAHAGPIFCLAELPSSDYKQFMSGGKDCLIKIWSESLECAQVIDVAALSRSSSLIAPCLAINSLDAKLVIVSGIKAAAILVGTAGGSIIELRNVEISGGGKNLKAPENVSVLVSSHASGELWGLAVHSLEGDLFATCGDDATLRVWSKSRLIQSVTLPQAARSVAWSHSGSLLVVGFNTRSVPKPGSVKITTQFGAIQLYSVQMSKVGTEIKDLNLILRLQGCESSAWISDLKFSPNDSLLGVASHDKMLYVYDVAELNVLSSSSAENFNWEIHQKMLSKPLFRFNKHSSAVLHFDFSRDNEWIQTNCQASELLYLSTKGFHEKSASKLADYNGPFADYMREGKVWHTQTCVFGWSVMGIWPSGVDASEINTIARNANGSLLATGDDEGLVKLFRSPSPTEYAKFDVLKGHSSHVTNVSWLANDALVSIGGNAIREHAALPYFTVSVNCSRWR